MIELIFVKWKQSELSNKISQFISELLSTSIAHVKCHLYDSSVNFCAVTFSIAVSCVEQWARINYSRRFEGNSSKESRKFPRPFCSSPNYVESSKNYTRYVVARISGNNRLHLFGAEKWQVSRIWLDSTSCFCNQRILVKNRNFSIASSEGTAYTAASPKMFSARNNIK